MVPVLKINLFGINRILQKHDISIPKEVDFPNDIALIEKLAMAFTYFFNFFTEWTLYFFLNNYSHM